jgi:hypothetical protein
VHPFFFSPSADRTSLRAVWLCGLVEWSERLLPLIGSAFKEGVLNSTERSAGTFCLMLCLRSGHAGSNTFTYTATSISQT